MPTRLKYFPAVLAILCSLSLRAQTGRDDDTGPSPEAVRFSTLITNLRQAKVTLLTDREVYFPGEVLKLTVTVTNPTSQPLEIPDPNDPRAQRIKGCYADYEDWGSSYSDPRNPRGAIGLDVRRVILQPGQSISLTVDSEDKAAAAQWCLSGAGEGTLSTILGGSVTVHTSAPVLETWAIVPLQEFKTIQQKYMKEPKTVQQAVEIVAVRLGGEHLVMVSKGNVSATYKVEAEQDGTFDARGGGAWVRLATPHSKVAKLSGTADPSGQITLEYSTEDGGGSRISLDKNRHPL